MSTRRDLIYRMTADPEGFKKGMREAGQDSNQFWRELKKLEQQQKAVDEVMTTFGQGMVVTGAAIGVGLGIAAQAAIEWESAWTGVAKVVDGSPEQMAALEEELRGLATTLPQTHAEIAGVAAAAGQLGIARADIGQFTRTMVAMGVSTNLASEEAATALARMMNIMGTAPDDVDRLGSAIVGLGNSSATTEAEIVEMALRIAGAGETVGMTEAEVLGFAAALSSVGIEAESGGSSISVAMVKISEAVNKGGESLEGFAEVAGVSADEFAQKFSTDPAQAIDMFVQGLGRINASGGDVFGTLESLGLSEIRLRDALLRLANSGDVLTKSLQTGNTAWEDNTALIEEAERRYQTTESRIKIARNQLVELGISLGETLLPAIQEFLTTASDVLSFFNGLPAPVKTALVVLAGVTAAIALAGGAALIAVPKIVAFRLALSQMGGPTAGRVETALAGTASFLTGRWGRAIGTAIGVLGGLQAASFLLSVAIGDQLNPQVDAFALRLERWAHTGDVAGEAARVMGDDMEKLGQSLESVADTGGTKVTAAFVEGLVPAVREFDDSLAKSTERVQAMDSALAQLQGENPEAAAEAFAKIAAEADRQGISVERLKELFPEYWGAIDAGTKSTVEASAATQVYAESLGIGTTAAGEAKSGIQELDEALRAITDTLFGVQEAEDAVATIVNQATEQFAENGGAIAGNTEEALDNRATVRSLISAYLDQVSAVAEATGSQEEAMAVAEDLEAEFRELARRLGLTEDQIDDYAAAFDNIPSLVQTTVRTNYVSSGQMPRIGGGSVAMADGGYVNGFADGGPVQGFPGGGPVWGAGTSRSDSIPARLSNGEFVINAAATSRHRALLEAINSGRVMAAKRHSMPAARFGSSSSGGGTVTVQFDFANVSGSLERAIRESVRVNGNGIVQDAFGSR